MAVHWPDKDVGLGTRSFHYLRHRPENTLLYQLVADLWPHFEAQMEREGRPLPDSR